MKATIDNQANIARLPNLGPKSEQMLNTIGIYTRAQLMEVGVVQAFIQLKSEGLKPSLNLLYAMFAALNNIHWTALSKHDRSALLFELDRYEQTGVRSIQQRTPQS